MMHGNQDLIEQSEIWVSVSIFDPAQLLRYLTSQIILPAIASCGVKVYSLEKICGR